ncbi:hypothetical protein PR048_023001 [Dryococelus australis]|uniref:Uncharacterized protein n=1 Tax=Dryococelus australis TaxID=614101 RepID=A0ABQ9GSU9_9NEOP|nr:hypothetical protein PR048_023001 [Dryococelus australis]
MKLLKEQYKLRLRKFLNLRQCWKKKRTFPRTVFVSKTRNGELRSRDWLTWNKSNESLFCFPCRLLGCKMMRVVGKNIPVENCMLSCPIMKSVIIIRSNALNGEIWKGD